VSVADKLGDLTLKQSLSGDGRHRPRRQLRWIFPFL